MAEALLEVRGLEAAYGEIQVLWGVDLGVPRGAIACLVGSNGAGKTTFMRAVSGLTGARRHGALRRARPTNAGPQAVLAAGIAQVPEGGACSPR